MRIVELELTGFRAFSRTQTLNFAADAVIVLAPNGQGKTSLFDAILWALAGRVPRLRNADEKLISLYSETGEMQVRLTLKDNSGELFHVTRSSSGHEQRLSFERGPERYQAASARARLFEVLWPGALTTADADASLSSAITRSVYLQQDAVRHFIESESDLERFNAVSDLLGTGRITDLQIQLDNARSAWSRATNDRSDEARMLQGRVSNLESQIAKLSGPSSEDIFVSSEWDDWATQVRKLGPDFAQIPPHDSSDAPLAIDSILKQLQAKRNSIERSKVVVRQLIGEIGSRSADAPQEAGDLKQQIVSLEQELDTARTLLKKAQEVALEERRKQVVQAQASEEMKALAQLALRHLGEKCPVCDQGYDKPKTIERLRELCVSAEGAPAVASPVEVGELAATVEQKERALLDVRTRSEQHARALMANAVWVSDRDRRMLEVGIDPTVSVNPVSDLEKLYQSLESVSAAFLKAQESGEKLALRIARSRESARRVELEAELRAVHGESQALDDELKSRQRTWGLATQILEALREASTEFVETELRRIEPLLQRIYARVDPHPAFKVVKFLTSFANRRGRLCMSILDPSAQISSETPETVLSSSQLNALAVSVFLALNLGVAKLPLQAAMLDDPLQSLDDINLLGVIDLLRRTKDARQLIVSTHDARFGNLLVRKFRPVKGEQQTRVVELEGWSRQGPAVEQREAKQDLQPLKIAV
jgi:DNA repair exonuclease SbcCD ATPase subunit